MSDSYVPETAKRIEVFGSSRGEEMARAVGAPLLRQLPINPEITKLSDEGKTETYEDAIMAGLRESLVQALSAETK